MSARSTICFGGPLNEQFIAAEGHRWIAALSPRPQQWLSEDVDPTSPLSIRTVTYTREKVACHLDHLCNPPLHDENCYWWAWCWVADGYPVHRITDALTGLGALADLFAGRRGYTDPRT